MKRSIEIDEQVYKELEYMVELHQRSGAPNPKDSVSDLVHFVLASIADGSCRPDAWERQLLVVLGLVADCEEHQLNRSQYGKPETE